MIGYIKLIRPLNCFMAAIAVLIGALLVDPEAVFSQNLYFALLAVFLITGAGNAINDYFDVESDRVNKPKRPIPAGKVSKGSALAFSMILFIAGIFFALLINIWICFIIAILNSILLILYSHYLQNKILFGNVVIGYLTGSTFLFGGAAMGYLLLPFILMLLTLFATMSREIVKDLEDLEGDKFGFLRKIVGKVTHPITDRFKFTKKGVKPRYSRKRAVITAGFSLILAVLISPVPYLLGILGIGYLLVVIVTDIIFVFSAAQLAWARGKKGFASISRKIKIGMFIGLIAFIVGILI